jgi:uncharacterized membrane protein YeaQ/YmgE (transglycosylase-associated protein family)
MTLWILIWMAIGAVLGGIARPVLKREDPGGIVATILLGVAGSLFGGFLATSTTLPDSIGVFGYVGAACGAMAMLIVYWVVMRIRQ